MSDENEHIYRFEGKWVRTINDKYIWNGRRAGGLSRSGAGDGYYSGEPVDLKVIRNSEINKIEKLVKMTEEETQGALNKSLGFTEWLVKQAEYVKKAVISPNNTGSELPIQLIDVKMPDESKFRPEEWKDIRAKVGW